MRGLENRGLVSYRQIMYTVARFTGKSVPPAEFLEIARLMNELRGDGFAEKRRGEGFACGVCDDPIRAVHGREILRFVEDFKELIQRAIRSGMLIEIDIAIGRDDYKDVSVFVVPFSPAMLSALGAVGIQLDISVY
jgi:hypothetical protein